MGGEGWDGEDGMDGICGMGRRWLGRDWDGMEKMGWMGSVDWGGEGWEEKDGMEKTGWVGSVGLGGMGRWAQWDGSGWDRARQDGSGQMGRAEGHPGVLTPPTTPQLLLGAPPALLTSLHLRRDPEAYCYTREGAAGSVSGQGRAGTGRDGKGRAGMGSAGRDGPCEWVGWAGTGRDG